MKIECPKCHTNYRLPSGRIPKGHARFKVRCKNCGYIMDMAVSPKGGAADHKWFVVIGKRRVGPLGLDGLVQKIAQGEIGTETYVWRKGFEGWKRLGQVRELAPYVDEMAETKVVDLKTVTTGLDSEAVNRATPKQEQEGTSWETAEQTTSRAQEESKNAAGGVEEEERKPLVFQRHEASVLFSLDDYRSRKRSMAARQTRKEGVVELRTEPDTKQEGPATPPSQTAKPRVPTVGVIALEEAEVKRVAEVLGRRKKKRRMLLFVGGGVAGAIVLTAAVLFVVFLLGGKPDIGKESMARVEVQGPKATETRPKTDTNREARAITRREETSAKKAAEGGSKGEPQKPEELPTTPPKTSSAEEPGSKASGKEKHMGRRGAARVRKVTTAHKTSVAKREAKTGAGKEQPKSPSGHVVSGTATHDVNALLAQFTQGKANKHGARSESVGSPHGSNQSGSLPKQLATSQIQSGLRKYHRAIERCVRSSGKATGNVTVRGRLLVGGDGRVKSIEGPGPVPGSGCIRSTLKKARFPRFSGPDISFPYLYIVSP